MPTIGGFAAPEASAGVSAVLHHMVKALRNEAK